MAVANIVVELSKAEIVTALTEFAKKSANVQHAGGTSCEFTVDGDIVPVDGARISFQYTNTKKA